MDTTGFLDESLPFQKNRSLFEKNFPEDNENFLILVEAATAEHSTMAARKLSYLLQQKKNLFSSVNISDDNEFFSQHALLYLDVDELDDLSTKLSDAQPFIGHLALNYHLNGLFEIIGKALNNQKHDLAIDLTPLLEKIDQSLQALLNGKASFLSWQELLLSSPSLNEQNKRHIIIAKPVFNFSALLPTKPAMDYARLAIAEVKRSYPSMNIRITGGPALEHEELASLGDEMVVAGVASLFLVCCSLWVGLRSFKLMLVTFIALIMGLILTAGYATLSVGHLNILSVAFAVLYIGLGVDFSLHICLRYREFCEQQLDTKTAILNTVQDMGFSLFLCALTTSIGFFAFIPTNYVGVSELGVISGGGMFIGFFISMIVLPALLKIFPLKHAPTARFNLLPGGLYSFPFRFKKSIRIISLLSAVGAAIIFTQLSFDSNPVNLRNQNSESVLAFKELLSSHLDSPFMLFALSKNQQHAELQAQAFKQLATVSETITLQNLLAKNQHEKLDIIDDLNLVLGTDLENFEQPLQHKNSRAALIQLQKDLHHAELNGLSNTPVILLQQLQQNIQGFIEYADSDTRQNRYTLLDDSILGLLPFTMQQLSIGLAAQAFTLSDLPDTLSKQWRSDSGIYKVMIQPKEDLNDAKNLQAFVAEVQGIDDTVTGYPVVDIASGRAVAEAFMQAFVSALVVIFLMLLIILRNFRNTLLVIGPLLLATLLTGALNVLLNNPFNFANSIAIPLLMGMGVDSGIHIMHRMHVEVNDHEQILKTSTARGVFFSSLTTLFSFTSLAFIPHAGIASMGLLLAIGISLTLFCTLIVLPAFSDKDAHY